MASSLNLYGQWTTGSGGSIYYNGGNVGIGTASPTDPLTIYGGSLGTTGGNSLPLFSLSNGNGNTNNINILQLRTQNGASWTTATTRIQEVTDSTNQGYIDFNPANGGYGGVAIGNGTEEYVRITGSGDVGIGTEAPISGLTILSSATDGAATYANGITFVNNAGNYSNTPWSHAAIWSQGSAGFNGELVFGTDGDGVEDTTGISERMRITSSGNVGIGTTNPQYPLSVNGIIQAKEVIVNTGWSDYVFAPDYHLRTLEETAAYIQQNHHLPEIPSEAEITRHGASVGEIEAKLLAKVEELTLQMIRLNEENKHLAQELRKLKAQ